MRGNVCLAERSRLPLFGVSLSDERDENGDDSFVMSISLDRRNSRAFFELWNRVKIERENGTRTDKEEQVPGIIISKRSLRDVNAHTHV